MRTTPTQAQQNLPLAVSSFVGRGSELSTIHDVLTAQRVVTLIGPGGVGKTRLALQAGGQETGHFSDGVWLVELAALDSAELVVETVAKIVNAPEEGRASPLDALVAFLREKRLLLILDNCEHLLASVARLVSHIVGLCPNVVVLATSRTPLGIASEQVVRVLPLSMPEDDTPRDMQQALGYEAIQLFVQRAQAAEPSFHLSEATAPAVLDLCRRLDGLPLALELAAKRVRGMGIAYLSARLDDRFRLLSGGDPSSSERHHTLRALVDWSYDLLPERERVVLRRTGIFSGDFSLEAAEIVCAGDYASVADPKLPRISSILPEQVLDALAQLVDKSLIQFDHDSERYRLLETVRFYARDRLFEADEFEFAGRQHFVWYLTMAQEGVPLLGGPSQEDWFDRIEREQDNVRAALAWAVRARRADEGTELALAIWRFWYSRAYLPEGLRWLEQLKGLESQASLPRPLRARLFNALGVLSHASNRFEQAMRYHNEALRLWRDEGDSAGVARGLLDIGWCYFQQMRIAEALSYATEGLAEARVANDPRLIASALQLAGTAGGESDAFADYVSGLDESLAIWQQLGDASNMAATLDALVRAELQRGSNRARALLLASVRLHMQTRDYATLIGSFVGLLYTAMNAPNQPAGARFATQALGMMKTWEDTTRGGDSPWAATRPRQFTEGLTAILGPDEFARAFAEGRAMSLSDLTPFAQAVVGLWEPAAVQVAPDLPVRAELTPREREVLALVAEGLTNAQIAERLVVTPRTINAHLTSVYSKLGVTSRAGAIRYALEHRSE